MQNFNEYLFYSHFHRRLANRSLHTKDNQAQSVFPQSHKLKMLLLTFLNTKRGVPWWARACWPSLAKKGGRRSAAQQTARGSRSAGSGARCAGKVRASCSLKSQPMPARVPSKPFPSSSGHVEPRSIGRTCLLKRVFVNTAIFTAVCFHSVDDFSLNLYLAEKRLKALDNGTFQDPPTAC